MPSKWARAVRLSAATCIAVAGVNLAVAVPAQAVCQAGPDGTPWCNIDNQVHNERPSVPHPVAWTVPPDPTYQLYNPSQTNFACYSAVSAPDIGGACLYWTTRMGVWVNGYPQYPPLLPSSVFRIPADSYEMESQGDIQFISMVANETIWHDEPIEGGTYAKVRQFPATLKANGLPVEIARDEFAFNGCFSQPDTVSICAHHIDNTGLEDFYKPAAEGFAAFGPAMAVDGDTLYIGRAGDTMSYTIVNCSAITCV